MYWFSRFMRHLLFQIGTDIVRNPEKYAFYARRASAEAQCAARNAKEKAKQKYQKWKEHKDETQEKPPQSD